MSDSDKAGQGGAIFKGWGVGAAGTLTPGAQCAGVAVPYILPSEPPGEGGH